VGLLGPVGPSTWRNHLHSAADDVDSGESAPGCGEGRRDGRKGRSGTLGGGCAVAQHVAAQPFAAPSVPRHRKLDADLEISILAPRYRGGGDTQARPDRGQAGSPPVATPASASTASPTSSPWKAPSSKRSFPASRTWSRSATSSARPVARPLPVLSGHAACRIDSHAASNDNLRAARQDKAA
jgi:hypothetical protein